MPELSTLSMDSYEMKTEEGRFACTRGKVDRRETEDALIVILPLEIRENIGALVLKIKN